MCFSPESVPPELPADVSRQEVSGERVVLRSSDGASFAAYVARPATPGDSGVVIFPDVRGLFACYERLAERFAAAGHRAIAIDHFGRTAGTDPRGDDFEYMPHVQQMRSENVAADRATAMNRLRDEGATRVFTVGFCLGGALSFVQATDDRLAGVVGFYGVMQTGRFPGITSPLEVATNARTSVLGLFGGADKAIPPEDVTAFEKELDQAGVRYETHTYPGAPHSFFDRTHADHTQECADAWRRMLAFMADPAAA